MKSVVAVSVLGFLTAGMAQAEVVLFDYTAVVERTLFFQTEAPSISFNGTTIAPTYTLHGTMALDLNDIASSDASNRSSMTVGQTGYAFTTTAGTSLTNLQGDGGAIQYDVFDVTRYRNSLGIEALTFKFSDPKGQLFDNLASPGRLTLADTSSASLTYYFQDAYTTWNYSTEARITSIHLQGTGPVPEPSTMAMMGLGAVLVAGLGLRRRVSPTAGSASWKTATPRRG